MWAVTFSVQTTKSLARPTHCWRSDDRVTSPRCPSWSAATQSLKRDRTPRPHVSEHSDHAVHIVHAPSRCVVVLWNSTVSELSCNIAIFYTGHGWAIKLFTIVYATADEADAYMFYKCFFLSLSCFFLFFFRPSKNTRQPFSETA